MQHRVTTAFFIALAMLPLAGCSASNDQAQNNPSPGAAQNAGDNNGANAAVNTPPIHVEQTVVMLKDGQPAVEQTYRQLLAKCSEGAPVQVKPLDPESVGKLGRTYLKIWYQGDSMAVRADSWDYTMTQPAQGLGCLFQATHQSNLSIIKRGEAINADLTAQTETRSPSQGIVRQAAAAATSSDDSDDAKMRAAVAAQLQQQGYGGLASQTAGSASALGQPCARTTNAVTGESCTWSGGGQWGFVTDDDVNDHTASPYTILLWRNPPSGNGMQWTTQTMTVGNRFDNAVFEPPTGLSTK